MQTTDQDNLAKLNAAVSALNRRDVDGMLAVLHPDVRLEPLRAVHDGIVYTGHDGLRQWLADSTEDWEQHHIEVEEVRALGPGRALIAGVLHVRYRESGVEFAAPGAWLCDFRDGLVSRIRFYRDTETALAASKSG